MAYKNKYNYRYIFISGCGMNCWKTISAAGFHFTKRKVVKCRHIFTPRSRPSDRLSLISVFSWPLISNFCFSYPLNSDFFLAPWNWTLIAVFCPPDFYFLFFPPLISALVTVNQLSSSRPLPLPLVTKVGVNIITIIQRKSMIWQYLLSIIGRVVSV